MLHLPVNELLVAVVVIHITMAMIVIRVVVTMTQDHVVVILQEMMIGRKIGIRIYLNLI